jgi:AcrR family transcriptional regulator
MPKVKTTRRRLSAEEAREAILVATEKRLLEVGPEGIRLQEIAADVGMSHPTILHHFGSRDGLVTAVLTRAMNALEQDLIACFTNLDAEPQQALRTTLDRVDEVMRLRGHARVMAWVALTQPNFEKQSLMKDVVHAIHTARGTRGEKTTLEDTVFGVLLTSSALFGLAILGPGLLSMMGRDADEPAFARFRRYLVSLFLEHGDAQMAAKKKR